MVYFGDSDSANNCGSTHTYPSFGSYIVTQVVENQYGCKDYYTLEMLVDREALVWIPNAFTPNVGGKNEFFAPIGMGVQNFHMMIV